jgi:hypothetical protein
MGEMSEEALCPSRVDLKEHGFRTDEDDIQRGAA